MTDDDIVAPRRERKVLFTGDSIAREAALKELRALREWAVMFTDKDDVNCDVHYGVLPEIDRRIEALEKEAQP